MSQRIIALEGIDGSGKGTQFNLLANFIEQKGKTCATLSFPIYESFFGKEVGEMLSGNGAASADCVDAKSMALWYAMDRKHCFDKLEQNHGLKNFDYVLLNRYTLSNAVYQGARANDQKAFADWVFKLEHEVLGLPTPHMYIVLDIDKNTSMENVGKKGFRDYVGENLDVYESSADFMDKTRKLYLSLAQEHKNLHIVNCMEDGKMLAPEEINKKIVEIIGI